MKFNSIEVKSQDFKENAEKVVEIAEEPTGNQNASNIILSNNVSEKVLFSGDGGDEVFTDTRYRSIYLLSFIIKSKIFKNTDFKTKYKNINRLSIKDSAIYICLSVNKIYLKCKKSL